MRHVSPQQRGFTLRHKQPGPWTESTAGGVFKPGSGNDAAWAQPAEDKSPAADLQRTHPGWNDGYGVGPLGDVLSPSLSGVAGRILHRVHEAIAIAWPSVGHV